MRDVCRDEGGQIYRCQPGAILWMRRGWRGGGGQARRCQTGETLRCVKLGGGGALSPDRGNAAATSGMTGSFQGVAVVQDGDAIQKQHILICKGKILSKDCAGKVSDVHQRDSGILLHQKGARLLAKESRKITSSRSVAAWGIFHRQQGLGAGEEPLVGVPARRPSPHRRCRWSGRSHSGRRCSSPRCHW